MNAYGSRTPVPNELDFLVNTLRNPNPSITPQNVLGYMYNYLPFLKHEHNLKVVFSSFLNNSVCFGEKPATFAENYLIIEVFKLIFDKKLKVSEPTLPVKLFYSVIERELNNFVAFNPAQNSWKALPIIAGISLCNGLRDDLLTKSNFFQYKWFFSEFDHSMDSLFKRCFQNTLADSTPRDISSLALLSLSLKYHADEDLNEYLGPINRTLVIRTLMDLIYGSDGGALCYRTFSETSPNAADVESFITAQVWQNPVVKHVNRVSFLLEVLFRELPYDRKSFEVLMASVNLLRDFSVHMNQFTASSAPLNRSSDQLTEGDAYEQNFWLLAKRIFFSQVTVLQGIISRFLVSKKSGFWSMFSFTNHNFNMEQEYQEICYALLECLHYMHFVLISIGQGGFDGYNYIYYVSLEILLRNNTNHRFEHFTRRLIQNGIDLSSHALEADYVSRSKCLFVFGLWENYFREAPEKENLFVKFVYSVVFDMVRDPLVNETLLVEGCHSVLLAYFSNKENTNHNLRQVLEYFELLVSQFPAKLSAHQLSVAVETLGKKIMANPVASPDGYYRNSAEEFLHFVHFRCSSTTPGQKVQQHKSLTFTSAQPVSEIDASSTMSQLKKRPENTDIVKQNKRKKPKDLAFVKVTVAGTDARQEFTTREVPDTVREGIILAFLNVVPYLPLSVFVHWLDKIWDLIMSSNQNEQEFLLGKFWKVLSENLDLNRSEMSHLWWYETKQATDITHTAKL